jgi:hypothetical protein
VIVYSNLESSASIIYSGTFYEVFPIDYGMSLLELTAKSTFTTELCEPYADTNSLPLLLFKALSLFAANEF